MRSEYRVQTRRIIRRLLDASPFARRGTLAAYLLALAGLTLTSGDALKPIGFLLGHVDKLLHALMYFGCTLVVTWAVRPRQQAALAHHWGAALLATAYGAALECLQGALPNLHRSFSGADAAANAIGAAIGAVVWPRLVFAAGADTRATRRLAGGNTRS
jgi:hypothetical protein